MPLDRRDREHLFRRHTPPPGGLARLRDRLGHEAGHRPRTRVIWAASLAAAGALALLLALTVGRPREPEPTPSPAGGALADASAQPGWLRQAAGASLAGPTLASLGLGPAFEGPVALADGQSGSTALLRVPVPGDDVVLYLLSDL